MSLSTIITNIENAIVTTEAYVQKVVQGLEIDFNAAEKWLADQAPTIVADEQAVVAFVESLAGGNAAVVAAGVSLNALTAAYNAWAAAYEAGNGTLSSVQAGYSVFTQAQAQMAAAKAAAAASTTTAVPGPAAS